MKEITSLKDLSKNPKKLVITGDKSVLTLVEELCKGERRKILHLNRVPFTFWRDATHPVHINDTGVRCLADER